MINGEREALGFRNTTAAANTLSTDVLHALSFRAANTEGADANQNFGNMSHWWISGVYD